jgi:hypothetical protein
LAAEVAVEHHIEVRTLGGAEGEEDLMSRIMTPRAWNEDVFEAMAGALSQVMGVNILIVSRSEKAPYTCWSTQCLGDQDSTEFQIRVLSYSNHYFWWRPSGARVFRDNVFIQQKDARSRKEQEKKRKRKERVDQNKKKKKKK